MVFNWFHDTSRTGSKVSIGILKLGKFKKLFMCLKKALKAKKICAEIEKKEPNL